MHFEARKLLGKLDVIVSDNSKFTKVEKSTRKNARHPIFMKQEKVKEAVNKHLMSCTTRETEQVKRQSGSAI